MEALAKLITDSGFAGLSWQNLVMFIVGGVLIYLAETKQYEPLLLIPIGFGAILANLPLANMAAAHAFVQDPEHPTHFLLQMVYDAGIRTEFLPPVIFLGVGALTDFRPLLSRPITFLLGAAAQFGILVAALGAFYVSRLFGADFAFTEHQYMIEDLCRVIREGGQPWVTLEKARGSLEIALGMYKSADLGAKVELPL